MSHHEIHLTHIQHSAAVAPDAPNGVEALTKEHHERLAAAGHVVAHHHEHEHSHSA